MNRNNLVIDVEAILDQAKSPITDDCCIYRVSYGVHKVNPDAYTPKIISIGPLHHFDQRLQNMEKCKHAYFKQFVSRAKNKLEDLISAVKEEEPRLRHCYKEFLQMSPDELVKVILVDACFIVELFSTYFNDEWTINDYKMLHPVESINMDLLLLDNQVPFFILEKLYNLVLASQDRNLPSFLELSINYLRQYNKQNLEPNFIICHFTDLLRTFHIQHPRPKRKNYNYRDIPTASAFKEAGGEFKINGSDCILDLQFSEGCLKIPHIRVGDDTEILFRNMLALEQCHYRWDGYIANYVYLMDFLINTEKDVDVLVDNGIVFSWLGDNDAVAKLFNSLGKELSFDSKSQYTNLFDEINDFYNDRWRQKWATLKRDYCSTPWRTLATCAAIAIVFLTIVQTVCSILQVV
ncbi:hypothetical protein L6164_017172 [Bauhinia variegata]|uniref:Uncharacterized protein n=1 Tax=Bauhinia variegata TaxID=167791 RepID=A0ACB9N6V9_BAUVA|nr:hypothetical protein L6164_017172 [Bauhinia variegata]